MATAKLSVELEALTGKYVADLNRAADKLREFSDKATRAGTALTAAFTVPLTLLARSAIKSGAELDGLNRSMIAITGSAAEAARQTKVLNEVAKLPGLNFKDSLSGFVQLKAAGFSTELATKSLQSFGNALGVLGKTGALGAVNNQLQQMATRTGSVGEDMRILKAWVPQVGGALQEAFGTQNTELIAQMGFTGKDVVEKLVNVLGKLPKATGGIGNALENMDDAWFKARAEMGLAIDKAIDLTGIFNSISEALTNVAKWFKELDPGVQKLILGFAGVAMIAGPVLFAMGAMIPLFANIGLAATIAGVAITTAFAGISWPIVAAVAAATLAFTVLRDSWSDTKKALVDKEFFDDLKGLFNGTLNLIANIFGAFKNALTLNWSGLWNNLKNIVILAVQPIVNIIATAFAAIQNTTGGLIKSFAPNWTFGGRKLGAGLQSDAASLLKDLDDMNADIKRRTNTQTPTKRRTQYEIDNEGGVLDNQILLDKLKPPKLPAGPKEYEQTIQDYKELERVAKNVKTANEAWEAVIDKINEKLKATHDFYKSIKTETMDAIGKQSAGFDFLGMKTSAFFDKTKKQMEDMKKGLLKPQEEELTDEQKEEKNWEENKKAMFKRGAGDIASGLASWAGAWAAGMEPIRSFAQELADLVGNMLSNLGQALMMQGLKTGNWGLAGIGAIASIAGSFTSAKSQPRSTTRSTVPSYQPIYTPYTNTGSNNGARISVELMGSSAIRGNDIITSYNQTIYDRSRG